MAESSNRYQLGPRSRRGLVAGWRAGQLAVVGTGLAFAVILLRSSATGVGAFLALGVVAVFVAFVTWPVAGRSAEQWTPVVARHLLRRSGLRRKGPLAALALSEIPGADPDARIGLVVDKAARTWTSAVTVGGSSFALGDDPERARRIAAWSGVLAASATRGRRPAPAAVDGALYSCASRRSFAHTRDDRGIAGESYASLLKKAEPALWNHEVIVTMTIRAASARADARPRRQRTGCGRRSPRWSGVV